MKRNEKTFQEEAMRTASSDFEAIQERLKGEKIINMLHAAIGLATEAAEALDMLKKHIYYGRDLDETNFKEEIGDSQWYAALGADACGDTLSNIQRVNIEKLKARYPDKFTSDKAINRDLDTERKILEDDYLLEMAAGEYLCDSYDENISIIDQYNILKNCDSEEIPDEVIVWEYFEHKSVSEVLSLIDNLHDKFKSIK